MKIVCVYHSIDLDGWMSAAIVKHWFNETVKRTGEDDNPIDTLDYIGYNYGQPIPDLSEYDRVIMCDISFPKETMLDIHNRLRKGLIWIDHHISAINDMKVYPDFMKFSNVYVNTNFAACELAWHFFFGYENGFNTSKDAVNPMPEIVRLLGRYDCFGHKQVWKSVVGYEGLYEVSNHGNVRSLDRTIIENNTGKERSIKGITLSITNSKRGYRVVVLCKDGNEKMKNVHQLVAQAFISNPENKPCINHKDFNRLNNHIENLEWCTYAENNLHSVDEGKKGKTVIQLTKDDEFVEQFDSLKRAESHTGIASQNIGKVCKGEREFAGEYKWEYGVDKDVFLQFVPEDEEQQVLEFQYGARSVISSYEDAYNYLVKCVDLLEGEREVNYIWDKGMGIYKYLCEDAKQSYKNGFEIFLLDPSTNAWRSFICINKERFNPINFGIDYHKDGYEGCACFHRTAFKDWAFSLYNDNGLVDVSEIAKQFGGGGHKGASGFRIKDLTQIF